MKPFDHRLDGIVVERVLDLADGDVGQPVPLVARLAAVSGLPAVGGVLVEVRKLLVRLTLFGEHPLLADRDVIERRGFLRIRLVEMEADQGFVADPLPDVSRRVASLVTLDLVLVVVHRLVVEGGDERREIFLGK
ncbi:hypothetical protein [Natrialba sp. INN-245]|uniref:hypothetical protein n=1 Tax=Natrialba sp. INN-245 TaxID=2690967 RepID=UPI001F181A23|nr:hypothetical protein [Natrialba sp. INN-245]